MNKLLLIISIVLVSLLIAGSILDSHYKKYWWPFFDKINVIIKDSSYYDGIYLGDSRVHFGINPYYTDSVTSLKSYNLGMGGATINEIDFILESYLQKHPAPKFALISIGYSGLLQADRYFQNPCYYFFYIDDSFTDSVLGNLHYHTTLYKILPILKYTAFDDFNKFSIAQNFNSKTILKPGGIAYKGFINNSTNNFNVQLSNKGNEKDTTSGLGLVVLEKAIRLLREKRIIPILVYPPEIYSVKRSRSPIEIKLDTAVSLLSSKYHTSLFYFDKDSSFTKDLFTDTWHLNIKGSTLYSKKIGAVINSILNQPSLNN